MPNTIAPSPRTSHSCVSYKNRFLVVIGGESEVGLINESRNKNSGILEGSKKPQLTISKSEVMKPLTTKLSIKREDGDQRSNSQLSGDDSHSVNSYSDSTPTQSLGDVWIFDTFLHKWFEIKPDLYIQGSSVGKKILK